MNHFNRESVSLSPYIKGGTEGTDHFTFLSRIKGTVRDRGDRQ